MKIKYVFADGTISEVEVDDELGFTIKDLEREFENYERKKRFWVKTSLDTCDYEGEWFADSQPTSEELMLGDEEREESEKRVEEFYKTLTEPQLKRLLMLEQGMTHREIAEMEEVNLSAVQKSIEQVRIKYKKFFNK